MREKELKEQIEQLKKILHRYNSGRRKENGFKIVASPEVHIEAYSPKLSTEKYWLITFWWLVGYKEKKRKVWRCTKSRMINWYFPFTPQGKKDSRQLFDALGQFCQTYGTTRRIKMGNRITIEILKAEHKIKKIKPNERNKI